MRYPEGQLIQVGDLIWWEEGTCVGFVETILEDQTEYTSWGLKAPSLAFTNLHPFEANQSKHKQHIGPPGRGGTTIYPESKLVDEGIGLLSDHEKEEFCMGDCDCSFASFIRNSRPSILCASENGYG